MNETLGRAAIKGCVYGLASYFHITLGNNAVRPQNGVEWAGREAPPRMESQVVGALKRGMLNHGVDLMGGAGGFTSGVHTDGDIDKTLDAFEATVHDMRRCGANARDWAGDRGTPRGGRGRCGGDGCGSRPIDVSGARARGGMEGRGVSGGRDPGAGATIAGARC